MSFASHGLALISIGYYCNQFAFILCGDIKPYVTFNFKLKVDHSCIWLGAHFCLLKTDLHALNTFLCRHYWFNVSVKSVQNSHLSCRRFLDRSENPFKTWAGRHRETCKAVSENWSGRKWKGEWSSQSPNIPIKGRGVGVSKVRRFCMASTAVCNEEGMKLSSVTPKVTASTGSYP